ncbi:MAG: hypothetical protein KDA24_07175 [Deltaproteobacteria bacterium]|nr:hypothetical protein [Deltaproteobacteria bacterium]
MNILSLRFLLLVLLSLAVGCAPLRRGSGRGGGSDDDDSASADDDDATGDDDDATSDDDDDATSDDDDDDDDDDGAPIPNEDDILGVTFALNLENATWVEPAGVGPLLVGQLENDIGFSPLPSSNLGGNDIELRLGALELGGGQDPCIETSTSNGDWANPTADVSGGVILLGGFPLDPASLVIVFGSTSSIIDGSLSGTTDMRNLYADVGLGSPDELCDLLVSVGSTCAPCSDGQSYCLDFEIEDLTGSIALELPLQARTEADVDSDPNCN